jgi:hypothetical protein
MMLSAIDGNDIVVTIAPEVDLYFNDNNKKIAANQFIFRKWELKNYTWLNERYFHLDIGPYRTLNDTTSNTNIDISANDLRIEIDAKKFYQAMDTVWIPVKIINQGKIPIFSGGNNKIFLSYFWVLNNEVQSWQEIRTPLQADITRSMQQDVRVAIPASKGRMLLKIDMIANDKWLGISSQEDVLVY